MSAVAELWYVWQWLRRTVVRWQRAPAALCTVSRYTCWSVNRRAITDDRYFGPVLMTTCEFNHRRLAAFRWQTQTNGVSGCRSSFLPNELTRLMYCAQLPAVNRVWNVLSRCEMACLIPTWRQSVYASTNKLLVAGENRHKNRTFLKCNFQNYFRKKNSLIFVTRCSINTRIFWMYAHLVQWWR